MAFTPDPLSSSRNELRDFESRIENTPSDATVKGMYIEAFLRTLDLHGLPLPNNKRYIAFKDYPLRDYMRMLLDACPTLHADYCIEEALKRQGRLVYPTLISTTVGKVIFALAGRSWHAALPLASRGWEISLNPGSAKLLELSPTSAVMALRDVYNFAECFQVGVMEGAMEVFQLEGTVVAQRKKRICDVDLLMSW